MISLQLVKKIVAVWDYVSIWQTEKCFHKAGFICSVLTAPEAEPEPQINIWDNMQQILNVQVPYADYATADDTLDKTERQSDAEIVDWVKGRDQPEQEEEGQDPDDDDDDNNNDNDDVISTSGCVADSTAATDESEIIHTSTQCLHVIAQQKAYKINYHQVFLMLSIMLNNLCLLANLKLVENKQICCHFYPLIYLLHH